LLGKINWEDADDFDSFIGAGSSNSVPGCFPSSKALGIEMGSFSLDFQALALREFTSGLHKELLKST